MSIQDFEPDQNILALDGVHLGNDPDGRLVANAVEADEFDPRIGSDIEGLLFLGYLTQSASIFGHHFVLKTLRRGERLAALQFVQPYEETLGIAQALETALLALSIISVDGRPLSIPLGPADDKPELTLERNWPTVAKWYDPVLDALYLEYQELQQRMNVAFLEMQSKSTASRRSR